LAERIRAAGAGIGAFYTPTGIGTPLAEGKEVRTIDGRDYLLEYPIHGDVLLVRAHLADEMGNLVYRKTGRNLGPIMAGAATLTIGEVIRVVPTGGMDPVCIVTPRASSSTASSSQSTWRHDADPRSDRTQTVARDIPTGSYVNLGIGQPTRVAGFLGPEQRVVLHTENGMLGMGPNATTDQIDPDLIILAPPRSRSSRWPARPPSTPRTPSR
jgi:hypothetical protein